MSLPHEKLVAWQRADDLFIEVHLLPINGFRVLSDTSSARNFVVPLIRYQQTSSKELQGARGEIRSNS